MARQAEAERNRRARIITAEGEYQAAERIRDAGAIVGSEPAALQLRYLQALTDLGAHNATFVVPLPVQLLGGLPGDSATPTAASDEAEPRARRHERAG